MSIIDEIARKHPNILGFLYTYRIKNPHRKRRQGAHQAGRARISFDASDDFPAATGGPGIAGSGMKMLRVCASAREHNAASALHHTASADLLSDTVFR